MPATPPDPLKLRDDLRALVADLETLARASSSPERERYARAAEHAQAALAELEARDVPSP